MVHNSSVCGAPASERRLAVISDPMNSNIDSEFSERHSTDSESQDSEESKIIWKRLISTGQNTVNRASLLSESTPPSPSRKKEGKSDADPKLQPLPDGWVRIQNSSAKELCLQFTSFTT